MPEHPRPIMLLHVYSQQHEHDEVRIVGTRDAIAALIEALSYVKTPPVDKVTCEGFFATDGEGFSVHIEIKDEQEMDLMPLPYEGRGD